MFARPAILALLFAATALAQSTTMPALPTLVDQLGDRDPAVRERARDALMLLTRDELPWLAEAARGQRLKPTQRSLLHDVVVQVYLTGNHNFSGAGPGFLGVTQPAGAVATLAEEEAEEVEAQTRAANGEAPAGEPADTTPPTRRGAVIASRVAGYDGYRALEIGDVITAIARPESGEADAGAFKRVAGFTQLRSHLATSHAGEWITLKILRNGVEREVKVRLASRPISDNVGNVVSGMPEGDAYWNNTFESLLEQPPGATSRPTPATTRPASSTMKKKAHVQPHQ